MGDWRKGAGAGGAPVVAGKEAVGRQRSVGVELETVLWPAPV